jgi:hypothetical protein
MTISTNEEISAIRRIHDRNTQPLNDGYITAYRAFHQDELALLVYVDGYQMVRDHRGLPDMHKGLGRNNWNVDHWEAQQRVVFHGPVMNREQFRQIVVTAKRWRGTFRLRPARSIHKGVGTGS